MITALILTMVVFIILILFSFQKKQYSYTLKLKAVKFNHDKELYKAQLEIQEQTFLQISREIHDNVGQYLSLARLSLTTLDLNSPTEAKSGIGEISEIIEKALEDLRDISKSMNPEMIKKGGLKRAIEMQVGFLQRNGKYHVSFHASGNYRLINEQKEIILFRILQEAVNNIIRHASASDIVILLSSFDEGLKLYIQDNGKGFDIKSPYPPPRKIGGITNMKERAKLIDARFEIESVPGKGTKITVSTTV
jgi:signal transduction histidine kinase